MPQVLGYTPAWLSKPNTGHEIFTAGPTNNQTSSGSSYKSNNRESTYSGPRRTIARRGTEIFIAVGKEIRWADLVYLKETWENKQGNQRSFLKGKSRSEEEHEAEETVSQGYRTLKIPVADDEIRQLIISSNSKFMAILTTHTVHIAILPEPSHLTAPDSGPMKIKTFHLGPTTHVTSRSEISTVLWHPLGVNGTCLVTVTKDAIVRVWELSTTDRWSFDKPTLAIDLKKLADGVSADQDFGASVAGKPSKFSPDAFEMEVASACFAGRGSGGWSPMTLWLAMKEAQSSKLLAQQQLDWMSDIDSQDPTQSQTSPGEPPVEVHSTLTWLPEDGGIEDDALFSDIYVIGPKIDTEELMDGEDDELELDEVEKRGMFYEHHMSAHNHWTSLDMSGLRRN
ncbi:hypothetical protein DID88_009764 [Monilinia fructigena]|uniref:Uncharacterized protein n=1 Tax=Monilinia fructigena TaxID=38457 RepID=A0A395IM08_9HELO|nr:hypothetical protein DID88_009764 [Monilinia fructigena]